MYFFFLLKNIGKLKIYKKKKTYIFFFYFKIIGKQKKNKKKLLVNINIIEIIAKFYHSKLIN